MCCGEFRACPNKPLLLEQLPSRDSCAANVPRFPPPQSPDARPSRTVVFTLAGGNGRSLTRVGHIGLVQETAACPLSRSHQSDGALRRSSGRANGDGNCFGSTTPAADIQPLLRAHDGPPGSRNCAMPSDSGQNDRDHEGRSPKQPMSCRHESQTASGPAN